MPAMLLRLCCLFGLLLPLTGVAADVLIRDVTLISPERPAPLVGAHVLIRDGRIARISSAAIDAPDATTIDAEGRFLIPGLIDSHVHLGHATGLKRRYTADFDRLYRAFQRQQPRSYLYFGYTTVIELNGDPEVARAFDATPLHPRREHCAALVLADDFLATDFDSPEDFRAAYPGFLHDRHTTPELPEGFDPVEHTPAAAVARIAAGGARCIKLYYEEALWWPGTERPHFSLPSLPILREVVEQAHARGLAVVMHGNTPAAHRIGLKAGVDVMAHGLWDWDGAMRGHAEIPEAVLATTDAVARSTMKLQPTWMAAAGMTSLFDPESLADPRLERVLGADFLDYLRGPAQQARGEYLQRFGPVIAAAHARGEAATDQPARIMAVYMDRYRRLLRRLHAAGASFLFGTDTAVGTPGWGNPPGLSGFREMQAWLAAGIDLGSLLRAATLDNAKAFGLERELGSIEVGKRADLLLLAANPLETIDAYDRIEQVILGGRVIERDSLAADAPPPVGVATLAVPARGEAPGFTATLWYLAKPGIESRLGASPIRLGYLAVADGEPALPPSAPLIVLTHGTGGSAQSLAWLATELARHGALVVAADHPASSGGDPERASMMQVWTQPDDVHHLLDTLLASPWGTRFDCQRIAAVGFSLGGASAMLLAGARLDFARFPEFCKTHDDGACHAFASHFEHADAAFYARANADLAEPRLRAAVAIAPGFTEAFTAESLRALRPPLLLLTGALDQQLPPATHVAPMRHLLPAHSRHIDIPGAQHFSFLPLCAAGAVDLLAVSGEEFVCQEFAARSRMEIHAEVTEHIVGFLQAQAVLRKQGSKCSFCALNAQQDFQPRLQVGDGRQYWNSTLTNTGHPRVRLFRHPVGDISD